MLSSIQTLLKILSLEEQKGFQNKAVIGGFARFAYHWGREAHGKASTDSDHDLVDQITEHLRIYEGLPPEARPATLEGIVALASGKAQALESIQGSEGNAMGGTVAVSGQDDIGIGQPDPDEQILDEESRDSVDSETLIDLFDPFVETGESTPAPILESVSAPRSVRDRRGYARAPLSPARPDELAGLEQPITSVKGVGEKRAEQLLRLNISSIRDMLYTFPYRHDDFTTMKPIKDLKPGEIVSVIGMVERVSVHNTQKGQKRVEAFLKDPSGSIRLNWFSQHWIASQIHENQPLVVRGKVDQFLGRLVMNSPEFEEMDAEILNAGTIQPVYRLTEGLTAKTMRNLMGDVVFAWARRIPDPLPESIREQVDLMDYGDALHQAHFPDSLEDKAAAYFRLAFDEMMVFHLAMLQRRQQWQSSGGVPLYVDDQWLEEFEATLPFRFTGAQRRAIEAIRVSMASDLPMNRLLQGDVGSGKTAVAATAIAIALSNGMQAAVMAPTSILAEQHYTKFSDTFANAFGEQYRVGLLTGHINQNDREAVYASLASGEIHLVVGTHALIQEGIQFSNLGLAVVDEQHRFGVDQRGTLRDKAGGLNPHLLVMTATPIPRTLALTLHADLDLTILDEMPPGRQQIATRILQKKERERAYSFIRGQIAEGHQAYIICPLVEDSESLNAKSATAEYERLRETIYPDLKLGLLHGQMSATEKEAAMEAFYSGDTQILVSTTVIEVGIDVPNATVIMVENANRFGLAQLHQLRGRVGRSEHKSFCLLVSDTSFLDTDDRLVALERTNDGFELAQIDWAMRGSGDLLGTQQSGHSQFQFADAANTHMLEAVQEAAGALYERDPQLTATDHQALANLVYQQRRWWGDIS